MSQSCHRFGYNTISHSSGRPNSPNTWSTQAGRISKTICFIYLLHSFSPALYIIHSIFRHLIHINSGKMRRSTTFHFPTLHSPTHSLTWIACQCFNAGTRKPTHKTRSSSARKKFWKDPRERHSAWQSPTDWLTGHKSYSGPLCGGNWTRIKGLCPSMENIMEGCKGMEE